MSRFFVLCLSLAAALCAGPLHADNLSLLDATRRVLDKNPQITLSSALQEAAEGRVTQAGVLPNPEVNYLLEDFAGDTNRSAGSATTTYSLSQRFSVSGKRSARRSVAGEERTLTALEAQIERLRLIRVTRDRYIDALAATERQSATEQNLVLAQQLRDAVAARVTAGKVSPIELSRANVALAGARRTARQAAQENQLARRQLASLWGESQLEASLVDTLTLPNALSVQPDTLDTSPYLKQAQVRIQREQAAVSLAEAQRLPDFTLSAGMKREAVTREQSVLVGVSVPIPLFDRNQGAVRSARAELTAAEAGLDLARQQLQRQRDQLLVQREVGYQEALQLRDEVLRTASEALEATREGYRAGKFSLIDLLDAQRSLIESQGAYLSARISYHKSDAALDELLGHSLISGNTL
ncbi:MAG: TolC family protein [Pseudomonadota bacterium]